MTARVAGATESNPLRCGDALVPVKICLQGGAERPAAPVAPAMPADEHIDSTYGLA
jgi:hypothetical protein